MKRAELDNEVAPSDEELQKIETYKLLIGQFIELVTNVYISIYPHIFMYYHSIILQKKIKRIGRSTCWNAPEKF